MLEFLEDRNAGHLIADVLRAIDVVRGAPRCEWVRGDRHIVFVAKRMGGPGVVADVAVIHDPRTIPSDVWPELIDPIVGSGSWAEMTLIENRGLLCR